MLAHGERQATDVDGAAPLGGLAGDEIGGGRDLIEDANASISACGGVTSIPE